VTKRLAKCLSVVNLTAKLGVPFYWEGAQTCVGGFNFLRGAISWKRCKIEPRSQLITNKSFGLSI